MFHQRVRSACQWRRFVFRYFSQIIEPFLEGFLFIFYFFNEFWILGLWIAFIIFGPRVSVDENAIG